MARVKRFLRRLLYLIPVILLGLSVTPFALYKDSVDYAIVKDPDIHVKDINDALTKLSPTHWKMIHSETQGSAHLDTRSSASLDEETAPSALSGKARFFGFPFGAYFVKNDSSRTALSRGEVHASAYSWLWAAVDGGLVLISLGFAFFLNRRKYISGGDVAASTAPIPATSPTAVAPAPTVFMPPTPASPEPAPPVLEVAAEPKAAPAPVVEASVMPQATPVEPPPEVAPEPAPPAVPVMPATPVPTPTIESIPEAAPPIPGQVYAPPPDSKPPTAPPPSSPTR